VLVVAGSTAVSLLCSFLCGGSLYFVMLFPLSFVLLSSYFKTSPSNEAVLLLDPRAAMNLDPDLLALFELNVAPLTLLLTSLRGAAQLGGTFQASFFDAPGHRTKLLERHYLSENYQRFLEFLRGLKDGDIDYNENEDFFQDWIAFVDNYLRGARLKDFSLSDEVRKAFSHPLCEYAKLAMALALCSLPSIVPGVLVLLLTSDVPESAASESFDDETEVLEEETWLDGQPPPSQSLAGPEKPAIIPGGKRPLPSKRPNNSCRPALAMGGSTALVLLVVSSMFALV